MCAGSVAIGQRGKLYALICWWFSLPVSLACCLPMSMSMSIRHHTPSSFQMEKFTGADLTEICQRAAKIAIRENIMKVRVLKS